MRILAAIIAVAVLAGAARADNLPDQRPMLRIETGMHTALIGGIGVDAACRLMVTGSDDKTARLWALPESSEGPPTLLRTLRVPIGEGYDGKVYAVALSPDGRWVAAGGWDVYAQQRHDTRVYIFDAATGRLVTRLGRLRDVPLHLTYSPDGGRLAAMLNGGEGMRLWDTTGWQLLGSDKSYGDRAGAGAAFDDANRLYTASRDGHIRRYGPDGRLEVKMSTHGDEPDSIAVHPGGTMLAGA